MVPNKTDKNEMNQHLTNASLQLIPIVQDRHPYEWVDEVIGLIEKSGLAYTVGPFGTAVEGTYNQINELIHLINQYLHRNNCAEWVLNVQWHIRCTGDVTVAEKTKGRTRN
jgi:uncharacterized protein YqgV (UPF0045/DUF77 family)